VLTRAMRRAEAVGAEDPLARAGELFGQSHWRCWAPATTRSGQRPCGARTDRGANLPSGSSFADLAVCGGVSHEPLPTNVHGPPGQPRSGAVDP
jgi:hypothetical protein